MYMDILVGLFYTLSIAIVAVKPLFVVVYKKAFKLEFEKPNRVKLLLCVCTIILLITMVVNWKLSLLGIILTYAVGFFYNKRNQELFNDIVKQHKNDHYKVVII